MTSVFSRDTQLKAMEMTISNAEKYMGQFCTLLAAYTRKTAKLRDKADMLARQLHDFACTEDPELSICLKNLSEDLAMVQDYRQAEVERLDTRVVTPLKAYGDIVKTKRADLKKFSADRNRELKELHRLEKIRLKNPADRQSISQAEVNVQKASSNANRSTRQMEDAIIDFQRQKLEDVKRIFTDFIMVEMLFHSKALEVYTHTFNNMETMDIHKDLELFRNRIQVTGSLMETTTSTADMAHYPSPPASTLRLPQYSSPPMSTLRLPQYPSPPPTIPRMNFEQPKQSLSRALRRQREMEEDEEEDEEEEEKEEQYDSEEDVEAQRTFRQSYAAQYVRSHIQK
ncbi:CBY1-interacting BAR domain-containing protein 2-like [Colossoma macropomum]|uniref:CBY1-interacting BAR domain-containing protein 2-like n=1 Tax=Colossoma macropomum TaxID=42526 RepID=UPI001863DD2D|nr:CBY1-interacting BAR domain-containing protein 2-like [Colossoma macropomum]